ncbi:MAG: protein-glutamate O-methyltransferase CheR [Pseudomonas marincola]
MNQSNQSPERQREFALSNKEFEKLTGLVHSLTGIVLGEHKKDMVYSRLARRLRELGLQSFDQYCALLDSQKAAKETGFLVNAITTNLTKLYRESHHFDSMTEYLTQLQHDKYRSKGDRSLYIWSAGCSSGEEPYSIASTIVAKNAALNSWKVKILATDLDTNMLAKGKQGIYPKSALDGIDVGYKSVIRDNIHIKEPDIHLKERCKSLVHFKQLNLLHDWPMKQKYDVIFCRNVLIYFDAKTKDDLVHRFTKLLHPGGMLFLGHSESLLNKPDDLKLIGKTSYVKESHLDG